MANEVVELKADLALKILRVLELAEAYLRARDMDSCLTDKGPRDSDLALQLTGARISLRSLMGDVEDFETWATRENGDLRVFGKVKGGAK